MTPIATIAELESLYGAARPASLAKVADRLTQDYARWIEAAKFCIVSTVGPEGTDASPRGDDGPVVRIEDPQTLALPDWQGNNRIDTLRNIVRDPRMSLLFMVPGSGNVVRVNGRGIVTADAALLDSFARDGKAPRTVVLLDIAEVYFQCARAILRADLWSGRDASAGLPSAGDFLSAMTNGKTGGPAYDATWPGEAAKTLW